MTYSGNDKPMQIILRYHEYVQNKQLYEKGMKKAWNNHETRVVADNLNISRCLNGKLIFATLMNTKISCKQSLLIIFIHFLN